jgi:hypothetical protein
MKNKKTNKRVKVANTKLMGKGQKQPKYYCKTATFTLTSA